VLAHLARRASNSSRLASSSGRQDSMLHS
jgi:hypothetical protein